VIVFWFRLCYVSNFEHFIIYVFQLAITSLIEIEILTITEMESSQITGLKAHLGGDQF
jgi:hypothetical protein